MEVKDMISESAGRQAEDDERLRAESREILAKNPFACFLDIELLKMSRGYVLAQVKKQKKLENVYGDIHGGALYSVADNLAGIAAASYGFYVTTVSGSIQYLKAVRNVDDILCEAKVIKPGKTISVVRVEISDGSGTLFNTAEFVYFNLGPKENVKN